MEGDGRNFYCIAVQRLCAECKYSFSFHGKGGISDSEKLELAKNNSHPDYYGKYATALSKKWGESHQLQPVQYVNKDSAYAAEFSQILASVLSADALPDVYADDVLRRLSYMKPLRGTMSRFFERKNANSVKVKLRKNFHDEREWRYVPGTDILTEVKLGGVIANPTILALVDSISEINQSLTAGRYRKLWLKFNYVEELYLLLIEKKIVRMDAKLTSTDSTGITLASKERALEIGQAIDLTFTGDITYSIYEQNITIYTANLLSNAKIKEISETENGEVRILYDDTDSMPMYISCTGHKTSNEAKEESSLIMRDKERTQKYREALTVSEYYRQESGN